MEEDSSLAKNVTVELDALGVVWCLGENGKRVTQFTFDLQCLDCCEATRRHPFIIIEKGTEGLHLPNPTYEC